MDFSSAKFNADLEEGWRLVRAMGTINRLMETAGPRDIPALKEDLIKATAEWRAHALMCLSTHVQEPRNCWCSSCVGIRSLLREEDEASYRPPISQAWLDDQAVKSAREAAKAAQTPPSLDADAEADAFLRMMM